MKEHKTRIWGAGIAFMITALINFGLDFVHFPSSMPVALRILIPQFSILLPPLVYMLVTKQKILELIRFKKIHVGSFFLVIPLVICINPFVTSINVFSLLFTKNQLSGFMFAVTERVPLILGVLLIAGTPAVMEEFGFRGSVCGSIHRDSNPWPAILISALCFGFMHGNFNQILYATTLGVFMAILVEASGSIIPSMFMHFVFNAMSTTAVYALPKLYSWLQDYYVSSGELSPEKAAEMFDYASLASQTPAKPVILLMGTFYLFFGLFMLVFAAALIYAISALNKRSLILRGMFKKKTPEQKEAIRADAVNPWTPFLIIGLLICFAEAMCYQFGVFG